MPVNSLRVALGSRLPWFEVVDLDGAPLTAASLPEGTPTAFAFLCNHSPYVKHIETSLALLTKDYASRGVFVVAIASNDVHSYPSDSPAQLRAQADRAGFSFPYCLDASQRAAKAFGANCTPEFFVYDRERRLVYHGQYDDSRPGDDPSTVTGRDLQRALDAALADDIVADSQRPSLGCSVKWRAGNEPAYVLIAR